MNVNNEYKSTNALFLGDRIAPQSIEIKDGTAVFNYTDRKKDEAMVTPSSVNKTAQIKFDTQTNTISPAP